ncbi:RNA polymerase sigma factor [Paraliomyxa miuraensis]|uniref:RNA polymerase sigma factor n=1 Tax=Paraliomyxa miuraensis TaxID=376150 RepID=UPI002250263A|nr:sigma-70 family RNA polymerase sigma factor [Paraliomyxa miuraensis]MCX4246685.1 sigma-70 family RNA polymerase sigma factor [Paraliomyxa miuraensis]
MSDDPALLRAWRGGNAEAGQALFRRYYDPIARFFINKVAEPPHDLVQETFMACVQGRDRIRDDRSFRSYLFGVAYKVLSGHLRRKYRFAGDPASTSIRDLSPGPSTLLRKLEEHGRLLDALRRLPLDLQVIIELRYWEQMSSVDISHVLDVSASTIRDRLQKGRELLERSLDVGAPGRAGQVEGLDSWVERIRDQMRASDGIRPTASSR